MTPRDQYLDVIRHVADHHGVPFKAIMARDRTPPVAAARQDAYRALVDAYGLPKAQVGRIFQRDHTTVLHGIRQARQRLQSAQMTFDLGGGQ